MRIGVVTPWDVTDAGSWSGVVAPMVRALSEHADVVVFQTDGVPDSVVDRALTRLLDRRFGKRYLPSHALATSIKRGRALTRRLKAKPVDAIVSIAASQDTAFLGTGVPVVQVSDTTYAAIKDFYPLFSHLNPLSSWQAGVQSRRSAGRSAHALAATDWAREALLRDDGFLPDDVTLAPFGPAITPAGDEPPRPTGGPLRLLMVSSDWKRKAGPDVLATWGELRRRGIDVELTVAGQAPALPPEVRALGRVTAEQMRELYATSHVLLELSRSNAAGVTATDAAAFGLPVVAADTGGMASIVSDGTTGFLVGPGDIQAAADRVERLTAPELRAAMGEAAAARAATGLSWDGWAVAAVAACRKATLEGASSTGRVAFFSPAVPYPGIEHAGGQYLRRLHAALDGPLETTWLVQDRPSVRHAFHQPGMVSNVVLLGDQQSRSPARRAAYRMADRLETLVRQVDSQPVPLAPLLDLLTNPQAKRAARSATTLDFQWGAWTKLAPWARLLNRRAAINFTFHDVMSQKCARSVATAPDSLRRTKWRAARLLARRWERRALRLADAVFVFSEKDRRLLDPSGRHTNIIVVDPPLADGEPSPHQPNEDAYVLFVGFMARPENVDALLWFVDHAWPGVRVAHPSATLRVAGGALPEPVRERLVAKGVGIDVLGFVPDLQAEYRAASVVVVPLLHGAGVKFKTIEALLEGAPVVTTPIGAEGIGDHSLFAAVTDEAAQFARAVVETLDDNVGATRAAEPGQGWAWGNYGVAAFEERIRTFYR